MMGSFEAPTADAAAGSVGALSTFLFTDIEGSTRLWEEHAAAMGAALAQHDQLLRASIEAHDGMVIKTTGDGILAVFVDPVTAIDAAVTAQRSLRDATWGMTGPLRVRMALHAGAAETRDGDYFGPSLNRVARILAIGHGGQIICSAVASVLAGDRLPASVELVDLGWHRLRDIDRPEQIFQVVVDDLPALPAAPLVEHAPLEPAGPADQLRRPRARAGGGRDAHRAPPLVTLIGTGGTGKTRLMLEAAGSPARPLRRRDLARGARAARRPVADPVRGRPRGRRTRDARRPGDRDRHGVPRRQGLLLLLDNAEHLVDGVATWPNGCSPTRRA